MALTEGYVLQESEAASAAAEADADASALANEQQRFWMEFLPYLKLDDPEQPRPRASRQGLISLSLPAPTSWLTVYRDGRRGELVVFLSSWRNTAGGYAAEAIAKDWAKGSPIAGFAAASKPQNAVAVRPSVIPREAP